MRGHAVTLLFGLACALAHPGCSIGGDYRDTGFRCADGKCPTGQQCVASRCIASNPGDAGAADTAVPVDAVIDSGLDAMPDAMIDAAVAIDAAPGPNLLTNPGFESGLTGWNAYNSILRDETAMPRTGTHSMVVCGMSFDTGRNFTSFHPVANNPAVGERYRGTLWVKRSPVLTEPAPTMLFLSLREEGGASAPRDHVGPSITPIGTQWVQLSAEGVIAASGRQYVTLIVWGDEPVDGVCFAADDGSLNLLP